MSRNPILTLSFLPKKFNFFDHRRRLSSHEPNGNDIPPQGEIPMVGIAAIIDDREEYNNDVPNAIRVDDHRQYDTQGQEIPIATPMINGNNRHPLENAVPVINGNNLPPLPNADATIVSEQPRDVYDMDDHEEIPFALSSTSENENQNESQATPFHQAADREQFTPLNWSQPTNSHQYDSEERNCNEDNCNEDTDFDDFDSDSSSGYGF